MLNLSHFEILAKVSEKNLYTNHCILG